MTEAACGKGTLAILSTITKACMHTHTIFQMVTTYRCDYKFSKMIGQKALIVILSLNLIGHPYIALEK